MKRAIIAPPVVAPAALGELKDWLAISTTRENAALTALIGAALETCEGFIGSMPLEATCEELLPATGGWQTLATRPVQSIDAVEGIAPDGTRIALLPEDYACDLDADGSARLRILRPGVTTRIAVRFTAGMAPEWSTLPEGLRHGVLRLAAHHFRQRENAGGASEPPAAVAALWRPWRRMRLL